MTDRCLLALTAAGSNYPQFINLSSIDGSSSEVRLTIRSPATRDGDCGSIAQVTLNTEGVSELRRALQSFLESSTDGNEASL